MRERKEGFVGRGRLEVLNNAERDVTSTTSNVKMLNTMARVESVDEGILPETMDTDREDIIHEVILGGNTREDLSDELLFVILGNGLETKVSGIGAIRLRGLGRGEVIVNHRWLSGQ